MQQLQEIIIRINTMREGRKEKTDLLRANQLGSSFFCIACCGCCCGKANILERNVLKDGKPLRGKNIQIILTTEKRSDAAKNIFRKAQRGAIKSMFLARYL